MRHNFSIKTAIPSEDLLDDTIFNEKRFVTLLKEEIVGQEYAIEVLGDRVASWKMGLLSPDKPLGVFLFVGPTGVGKTELAKQLAKRLFHSEKDLLVFDGSEYRESHTLSNLVGAPRGYENHDSGGMLTGPLLDNPYRVVLFDEFEKAHDEVRKLFLQVFDQGRLTDRRGRIADCTKTLFILTSNLGSQELFSESDHLESTPEKFIEILKPILVEHLSPEMCGRFTGIVPFTPIRDSHLVQLTEVQLRKIKGNLAKQRQIELQWTSELVKKLASTQVDLRFGGRIFCEKISEIVGKSLKNAFTIHQKRLNGKILLDVSESGEISVNV